MLDCEIKDFDLGGCRRTSTCLVEIPIELLFLDSQRVGSYTNSICIVEYAKHS
jgi:hypothetical protein